MRLHAKQVLAWTAGIVFCLPGCGGMDEGLSNIDPNDKPEVTTNVSQALTSTTGDSMAAITISGPQSQYGATSFGQWSNRPVTITVTSSALLQNNGYVIDSINLFKMTNGKPTLVVRCGSQQSCSCSDTEQTGNVAFYGEVFVMQPSLNGRQLFYSKTPTVTVYWGFVGRLDFAANPTTVGIGETATITATSDVDIGPSPYYFELFDVTTGTLLRVCGSGTSCSATVSSTTPTTHTYAAFLTTYTAKIPNSWWSDSCRLAGLEQDVTWSSSSFRVALTADKGTQGPFIATTNIDVAPPYYITIYLDDRTRVAMCGSGRVCSWPGDGCGRIVAFVSKDGSGYPPPAVQANSNALYRTCID